MKQKEKYKYIFPNMIARWMRGVNAVRLLKVQLVATLLVLVGLSLLMIYRVIYFNTGLLFTIFILFNLVAAFVFMLSRLGELNNQYQSQLKMEVYK